jgi:hypothetical protein
MIHQGWDAMGFHGINIGFHNGINTALYGDSEGFSHQEIME